MKYLPLILVCVIGCLHTSSSEKRHAHDREFTRNITEWVSGAEGKKQVKEVVEEWVVSAEGQRKVVTLLEENFEVLLWKELNKLLPEGVIGTIALVFGGAWLRERDKKKYENKTTGRQDSDQRSRHGDSD